MNIKNSNAQHSDVEDQTDAAPTDPRSGGRFTIDYAERPKRVVIVGAGEAASNVAREVSSDGNYEVVGFLDDDSDLARRRSLRLLGSPDDVEEVIREYQVDEVFVVYYRSWLDRLARNSMSSHRPVGIKLVPSIFESMICRLSFERLHDVPMVSVEVRSHTTYTLTAKRCFDVISSLLMLLAASPIMALVSLAIKLTSHGSILFRQARVGRNGKLFRMMKFRTMVQDAEKHTGPVLAEVDDPRTTCIGRVLRKTRLDELPQLLNVLLGQMSLVGPRPERPEFVEVFDSSIPRYAERHRVKPGITGLAQVQGHYLTDAHTKLRHDLMYINNMSLRLDVTILLRTLGAAFYGHGGI